MLGKAVAVKCDANKYPSKVLPPSPKKVCALGKFQHNTPKAIAPIQTLIKLEPEAAPRIKHSAPAEAMNIEMHSPFTPSIKLYALVI